MIENIIIGVDSMIGAELFKYLLNQRKSVVGTTRKRDSLSYSRLYLDMETLEGLDSLPDPQVVYIVAAVARLEACKQNPEVSHKINVDAVRAICEKYAEKSTFIIFLSTDKVFNGKEELIPANHPTDPQSEYGRQKAEAEMIIREYTNSAILRLTKVLGKDVSLFENWMKKLEKKEEIYPFSDMVMAPISVGDVCYCLSNIAENRKTGIYQLSGDKDISYAEAALIGAKVLKLDETLIKPIKTSESGIFNEIPPAHASLKATSELTSMPINTENLIKDIFNKIEVPTK